MEVKYNENEVKPESLFFSCFPEMTVEEVLDVDPISWSSSSSPLYEPAKKFIAEICDINENLQLCSSSEQQVLSSLSKLQSKLPNLKAPHSLKKGTSRAMLPPPPNASADLEFIEKWLIPECIKCLFASNSSSNSNSIALSILPKLLSKLSIHPPFKTMIVSLFSTRLSTITNPLLETCQENNNKDCDSLVGILNVVLDISLFTEGILVSSERVLVKLGTLLENEIALILANASDAALHNYSHQRLELVLKCLTRLISRHRERLKPVMQASSFSLLLLLLEKLVTVLFIPGAAFYAIKITAASGVGYCFSYVDPGLWVPILCGQQFSVHQHQLERETENLKLNISFKNILDCPSDSKLHTEYLLFIQGLLNGLTPVQLDTLILVASHENIPSSNQQHLLSLFGTPIISLVHLYKSDQLSENRIKSLQVFASWLKLVFVNMKTFPDYHSTIPNELPLQKLLSIVDILFKSK